MQSNAGVTGDPFDRAWIAHAGVRMALCTFAILVFELALIRWVGTQIRFAAYVSNLVLIAAFLGMGLGVALGRRHPEIFRYLLLALALLVGLLSLAEPLDFLRIGFADTSVAMWGAERSGPWAAVATSVAVVVASFWAIAGVFVLAGVPVGWLFERMSALNAYGWDLLGSLCGVIAMSVLAWLSMPPPVWFGLGVAAVLLLDRRMTATLAGLVIVAAASWSVGSAVFSPYNRIDVAPLPPRPGIVALPSEYDVSVNRDYHQNMLDLSASAMNGADAANRRAVQSVYDLPFELAPATGSVLVVGAGTGNDVAAALRRGMQRVVSVDIDPEIIEIGRKLHPERPYADPRVIPVVNDARAYFEQNRGERFDLVVYGLLDSHAMFSAMGSLRLDNYVYTIEGLRAGWEHVAPGGMMSVSFSVYAGEWMTARIFATLREATGRTPVVVRHGYNYGATFLVADGLTAAAVGVAEYDGDDTVRLPTDDWPFLYLRPGAFPWVYLGIVLFIALSAVAAIRAAFGRAAFRVGGFDPQMFFLGAAFMLLQTRAITELSLLFGSTWVVNSSVFAGVLVMVLAANALVARRRIGSVFAWYAPLCLSLVCVWLVSAGTLNQLPMIPRAVLAGLLYATPIFFAGVIFSTLLGRSRHTGAALGSNLCGAVLGGLLEYLSMLIGMRALGLLGLAIYLLAALSGRATEGTGSGTLRPDGG